MALSKLMQTKSSNIILLDAQVIIDLHAWSLWKRLNHACIIGVTSIIKREARFYKDGQGQKQSIVLKPDIEAGLIREIEVANKDVSSLGGVLNPNFLPSLDVGELETIAFLYCSNQKNQYHFCSADGLAIKCLGAIGLRQHAISLEDLFDQLRINFALPQKYSKVFLKKMLGEGFRDSHLYLQKS